MKKIEKFVKSFSSDCFTKLKPNIKIIGRKYYLLNDDLLSNSLPNMFSTGLFLGEKKEEFIPSLALLEIISKDTEFKVRINKESEWLFLCGRDVFYKALEEKPKYNENKLILVQNKFNENLGLGKKGDNMIKNIVDRGNFLRHDKIKRVS